MKNSGSSKSIQVPSKAQLFNKHPVIATILWIFGTETHNSKDSLITTPKNSLNDLKSNTGTLTWKDDHGGHIAEYMQVIQVKENDKNEIGKENGITDNTINSLSMNQSQNHNHDTVNESPQWGFYVAITPPQNEIFAKPYINENKSKKGP